MLYIPFILASIIFVSACSSGGGVNESTNANKSGNAAGTETVKEKAADPVKLRIYWWGSQNRHDATQKAMELYTQLNPHVTFEPEYSGWDGYFNKMATMTAAKNMPDIVQMDSFYLEDYAKRGTLAELSTAI
ncbi:putative ABC transporter substrate-binding protein YesO [compost metagenome]